eukprot:sb/3473589/
MAKTEKLTNGTATNGFDHHHTTSVDEEVLSYSPNLKRKRLQKPKAVVDDCNNTQILVESLLKAEPTTNGHDKTSKPCRRSERKIIPNSLWDNAVINPFYEWKRRKVLPKISTPPKEESADVCNGESRTEVDLHYQIQSFRVYLPFGAVT